MKLRQGQVWKLDKKFIRIVTLERLAVGYKMGKDLPMEEGTHHQATKKEFCNLLKQATLLDPEAAKAVAPPPATARPQLPQRRPVRPHRAK